MSKFVIHRLAHFYFQINILTVRAADGILITVVAIERGTHVGKSMPHQLNAYYVRAAHTYRTVYGQILEAYFAAGLFSVVLVGNLRLGYFH